MLGPPTMTRTIYQLMIIYILHTTYYKETQNKTMAGLGRRTHYRKHLTDSVLHDLPEPDIDERIAKVVSTRGSNQFDVIVAESASSSSHNSKNQNNNEEERKPQLAILPTKFHKLVWVKRNDYVIVRTTGEEEEEEEVRAGTEEKNSDNSEKNTNTPTAAAIQFMITHILYKDQIKHLQSKGLWPDDPMFEFCTRRSNNAETTATSSDGIVTRDNNVVEVFDDDVLAEKDEMDDDGIVYSSGYGEENDDDLFVNTNRIARLEIQDSSSSDEEEDSSDDDD